MDGKTIVEKVESLARPVVESMGFSLAACEYLNDQGHWVLRVYIEKPAGPVSVEDCALVSRALAGPLDVEGVIGNRYLLEVSSPGLNRLLRTAADFTRFAGNQVRLRTVAPIDGRGNYPGKLEGMDGNNVVMNIDGVTYKIPIEAVAKARLEFVEAKGEKRKMQNVKKG